MADYRVTCVSCGRELQMIERLTKAQRCQICLHQENLRKKREQEKQMTNKQDMVNHPSHYKQGKVECIEAIKAALTPEEFRGYCKGNIIKYTWRERHKGGDESLQKADWYLGQLLDD